MKNIGILVSGGGTNLQAIIDALEAGKIENGRIALVLSSSSGAFALERARKHAIPTTVVEYEDFKSDAGFDRDGFSAAITERFEAAEIDLVVLAGFNYILSHVFVSRYENRIMNVHPALIPSFCGKGFYGLHTHEAVLASGVKLTGATVHFVNDLADAGPIIAQKAVEVKYGDTPEILQRRVMEQAEWIILPRAINLYCNDKIFIENGIAYIKE